MTIEELRSMTNWCRTLKIRSVYAVVKGEANPLRIIGVGNKYVGLLRNSGQRLVIDPADIVNIKGLS